MNVDEFLKRAQYRVAELVLPRIRAACNSSTLRAAFGIVDREDGATAITVPHYWAAYYHDGHGEFGPGPGKTYLVWFANPLQDDPRLGGRYPIRYQEWRPLTREEFKAGLAVNVALGGGIGGPFMICTRSVGPKPGTYFYEGHNPSVVASGVVPEMFSAFVKDQLGDLYRAEEVAQGSLRLKA